MSQVQTGACSHLPNNLELKGVNYSTGLILPSSPFCRKAAHLQYEQIENQKVVRSYPLFSFQESNL